MIVEIEIPNNIVDDYNELNKIDKNAIVALIAYKDYANGNKSLRNIADELNMSKIALVDIYEKANLSIVLYTASELRQEIENSRFEDRNVKNQSA